MCLILLHYHKFGFCWHHSHLWLGSLWVWVMIYSLSPANHSNASKSWEFVYKKQIAWTQNRFVPDIQDTDLSTLGCMYEFYFMDHLILYPPTDEEKGLKLLGRLALLSEADLWSLNGLPNEIFPSDHLSLLAKFQLCWVSRLLRSGTSKKCIHDPKFKLPMLLFRQGLCYRPKFCCNFCEALIKRCVSHCSNYSKKVKDRW